MTKAKPTAHELRQDISTDGLRRLIEPEFSRKKIPRDEEIPASLADEMMAEAFEALSLQLRDPDWFFNVAFDSFVLALRQVAIQRGVYHPKADLHGNLLPGRPRLKNRDIAAYRYVTDLVASQIRQKRRGEIAMDARLMTLRFVGPGDPPDTPEQEAEEQAAYARLMRKVRSGQGRPLVLAAEYVAVLSRGKCSARILARKAR